MALNLTKKEKIALWRKIVSQLRSENIPAEELAEHFNRYMKSWDKPYCIQGSSDPEKIRPEYLVRPREDREESLPETEDSEPTSSRHTIKIKDARASTSSRKKDSKSKSKKSKVSRASALGTSSSSSSEVPILTQDSKVSYIKRRNTRLNSKKGRNSVASLQPKSSGESSDDELSLSEWFIKKKNKEKKQKAVPKVLSIQKEPPVPPVKPKQGRSSLQEKLPKAQLAQEAASSSDLLNLDKQKEKNTPKSAAKKRPSKDRLQEKALNSPPRKKRTKLNVGVSAERLNSKKGRDSVASLQPKSSGESCDGELPLSEWFIQKKMKEKKQQAEPKVLSIPKEPPVPPVKPKQGRSSLQEKLPKAQLAQEAASSSDLLNLDKQKEKNTPKSAAKKRPSKDRLQEKALNSPPRKKRTKLNVGVSAERLNSKKGRDSVASLQPKSSGESCDGELPLSEWFIQKKMKEKKQQAEPKVLSIQKEPPVPPVKPKQGRSSLQKKLRKAQEASSSSDFMKNTPKSAAKKPPSKDRLQEKALKSPPRKKRTKSRVGKKIRSSKDQTNFKPSHLKEHNYSKWVNLNSHQEPAVPASNKMDVDKPVDAAEEGLDSMINSDLLEEFDNKKPSEIDTQLASTSEFSKKLSTAGEDEFEMLGIYKGEKDILDYEEESDDDDVL